jgi:ribosomal protein S18 acetylase RimI-like enzyme
MTVFPTSLTLREQPSPADRQPVFQLLNAGGYFLPREMAYGMDLFDEHLRKGEKSHYRFILAEDHGVLRGYACYGPIRLSNNRFHLHWIAVDRNYMHHGLGSALEHEIVKQVKILGGVKIFAETSHRHDHAAAHAFYESCGYEAAASVSDYYSDGDDMVFYVKDVRV